MKMRVEHAQTTGEKRLLDANEICHYLSLGRNKGIEFAKSIGAERKIGRRSLYDKKVIDEALDNMADQLGRG